MKQISVIICSHNPRPPYLQRVLEALKGQTLPRSEWEVLLVDNASCKTLAQEYDLSWHPHPFHIRENDLGLMPARLRGIKDSNGSLLLFLDDDNVLAPDYLERALDVERSHPYLGVFGAGVITPEFEVEPPSELVGLLPLLALREVPSDLWSNNAKDTRCIPWGAGLCVTRPVASAYIQMVERLRINHLLGRRGQRLFSGDDDVFSWASAASGRGFGIFRDLRLTHLINADRLTQRYFLCLVHDHAHSHAFLNYLLAGEQQRRVGLRTAVRILLHGIRRGLFSMRCQWAAARGISSAARVLEKEELHPILKHPTEVVLNVLLLLHSAGELSKLLGDF